MNTFDNKVIILAELWIEWRDEPDLQDFIEYNDLGLPLAYAINREIVEKTDVAEKIINESYDLLVESLGITDSPDYEQLTDLLNAVPSE